MKKIICTLMLVSSLVGCASSDANLQIETARYIGNVSADDVQVDNVERGVTSVKWDAQSPVSNYKCSADDMVRRVHCVKN